VPQASLALLTVSLCSLEYLIFYSVSTNTVLLVCCGSKSSSFWSVVQPLVRRFRGPIDAGRRPALSAGAPSHRAPLVSVRISLTWLPGDIITSRDDSSLTSQTAPSSSSSAAVAARTSHTQHGNFVSNDYVPLSAQKSNLQSFALLPQRRSLCDRYTCTL